MTTPTSLIALLRAVAFGWRQQSVAENAEKIRELGEELYKRLATFNEHLGRVGRALGQSVEHYNKAVGSLERQVMPSARRFPEMGIHEKKSLEEPDKLEVMPRDAGDGTE
jgi:DNA recombination protein RmuC